MEKLTTGQMIDKLGLEDTAVNEKGFYVGYNHRGDLITWDKGEQKPDTDENRFNLYYPWVKHDLWMINYHFVSFEEALEAYSTEKKTIVFYVDENLQYRFEYREFGQFDKINSDGYDLAELAKGKWIIEN